MKQREGTLKTCYRENPGNRTGHSYVRNMTDESISSKQHGFAGRLAYSMDKTGFVSISRNILIFLTALLTAISLLLISSCSLFDTPETCVIRYHGNGAAEGRPPLDIKLDIHEERFIPRGNIFSLSRPHTSFLHWNSKPDGTGFTFIPGEEYLLDTPMLDLYAQWTVIGGRGPSGGFIFYENKNWEEDGWRYLEAAAEDQNVGIKWGDFKKFEDENGFSRGIGDGLMNTYLYRRQMFGDEEASAFTSIREIDAEDASMWYLPSRDELLLMFENLHSRGIGSFADAHYWSSSPGDDPGTSFSVRFSFSESASEEAGEAVISSSAETYHVRAVRKTNRLSETAEVYTVNYRKLGDPLESGTVPVDACTYEGGQLATAEENTGALEKDRSAFLCWNTRSDGTGDRYYPGDPILIRTSSVTLYPFYTIIGQKGEAGGIIFYENENWEEDGWRYLEAAPSDIDKTGLNPLYTDAAVYTSIGSGDLNTSLIIDAHPEEDGPAVRCEDLVIEHEGRTYDDWYFPAVQELVMMLKNLGSISGGLDTAQIEQEADSLYQSSTNVGPGKERYSVAVFSDNQVVKIMYWYGGNKGNIRPVRKIYVSGAEETYSLVYHRGDAGTGAVPSRQDGIKPGTAVRIQSMAEDHPLQKQYHRFVGWNTRADGSGIRYQMEDVIVVSNQTVNLYPEWTVIGAEGPAGGVIFYENENWKEDGWRYMEYADVMLDQKFAWGPPSYIMGTAPEIGAGQMNTGLIIKALGKGEYASLAANDFSHNGYDDWFLPSVKEAEAACAVHLSLDEDNTASWDKLQTSTQIDRKINYYTSEYESKKKNNQVVLFVWNGTFTTSSYKPDKHQVLCVRSFLNFDDPGETYDLSYSLLEGKHIEGDSFEPWSAVRLPEELPSYENSPFSLAGWKTSNDDSGKRYAPGDLFIIEDKDVELIAEFTAVGSKGPAGGLVFYENPNPNWEEDGWRYLETSLDPQPVDRPIYIESGGGLSYDIGKGELNTIALAEQYPEKETQTWNLAMSYTKNGYDDWFVPSKDTLQVLNDYLLSHDSYEPLSFGSLSSTVHTSSSSEAFYYVYYRSSENYSLYYSYDHGISYSFIPVRAFSSFTEEEETYSLHFDLNEAEQEEEELHSLQGFQALDIGTIPYTPLALNKGPFPCKGWNTQPDGFGETYKQGDIIRFNGRDITLYAEWNYVNEPGEAGGTIVYDNPYYRTDGWRFLEAAPEGIEFDTVWGNTADYIGAFRTFVRDGLENNELWFLDEDQPSSSAFTACTDYTVNGYDDWFLPSLNEMLLVSKHVTSEQDIYYWTSSEADADKAYFVRGTVHSDLPKDREISVYPVRVYGGTDE
ncbi:MAG: DUF1566 domain-containing protein [Spirochaetia bacterium]|nr:DUF1566 domain-containing protein [Spirochaetia bacterium]